jgi:hypothetical protein
MYEVSEIGHKDALNNLYTERILLIKSICKLEK